MLGEQRWSPAPAGRQPLQDRSICRMQLLHGASFCRLQALAGCKLLQGLSVPVLCLQRVLVGLGCFCTVAWPMAHKVCDCAFVRLLPSVLLYTILEARHRPLTVLRVQLLHVPERGLHCVWFEHRTLLNKHSNNHIAARVLCTCCCGTHTTTAYTGQLRQC